MKVRFAHIATLCFVVLAVFSCSTHKNTGGSRFWHSFNAKYNTYYNGTVAFSEGNIKKEEGNKDNFTELLPVYYVENKNCVALGSSDYDRTIEKCEKAIKLHSIKKRPVWKKNRRKTARDQEWLSRKEYNPLLWKAWLLMGKAQFHKGDFDAAAATFTYMSRLYRTQPAIYAQARAWLAKCDVALGWTYDAEDVIRNMQRDSIHWSAQKEWNATLAHYYIKVGEYEKATPHLQKTIKGEPRRKQKARLWFILGQVLTLQNRYDEAYKAYKKVVGLNPPYELEFNARIAMTEVMAGKNAKAMISKLNTMARNDNNKEYLDQVYYALGNIFLSQKDTLKAISAYEKGVDKGKRNGIEKGVLLLRLADVYWEKERFSDAARCYGQAVGLLDKDRKDYNQVVDRSKKLDQLVPFTEAIHLQDSLQALASMGEKERNEAIDRVINELKRKEKEERNALSEQNATEVLSRGNGDNNRQNSTNRTPQAPQSAGKEWYFYNSLIVTQGKQAFEKQWGKRENKDHWQRSNRTVVDFEQEENNDSIGNDHADEPMEIITDGTKDEEKKDAGDVSDPHKREYYLAQIPFTYEEKAASDAIIMDALYQSGVIFKDKINNLKLADNQLQRILSQYPQYENMPDVLYHLFLLHSRMGQAQEADTYLAELQKNYPDNKWTLLLSDPYYAENQKFGVHIEDSIYAATYEAFKADRLEEIAANTMVSETRFPMGANRDKFIFIGALGKLNSGKTEECLADMNSLVQNFPQSKLAEMAGMIINGVKKGRTLHGGRFDIDNVWARRQVVFAEEDSLKNQQYSAETNTNFSFLIAFEPDSVNENRLLYALAKYNFTSFLVRNFEIETEQQEGLHLMAVNGFANFQEAQEYARQFHKQQNIQQILGRSRTYIISADNRKLLGKALSYEDYERFYAEHFAPLSVSDELLLLESLDKDTLLDDGGSVPANIKQILQKTEDEEKPLEDEEDDDDEVIIIDAAELVL